MSTNTLFYFYIAPLWACSILGMFMNIRWMRTMMNWQKAQDQQIKRIFLKTLQKDAG